METFRDLQTQLEKLPRDLSRRNAIYILGLLRREEWKPTRIVPVDEDCVAFLFVKAPVQVTIDCYNNGEIIFGRSSPGSLPEIRSVRDSLTTLQAIWSFRSRMEE